jgi:hypothetical protein
MVDSSTQLGNVNAYRVFDISDIANINNSLAADSASIENALLLGFRTASKDFYVAKDGIAGKLLSYAVFEHNTAVQGFAVATVELSGTPIPRSSVVLPGYFVVQTAYTSGTSAATLALGTKKQSDGTNISTTSLLAAAVVGTNGTAGNHATLSTSLLATTDTDVTASLTVGVEVLTAGAGIAYLPYVVPSVGTVAVTYR